MLYVKCGQHFSTHRRWRPGGSSVVVLLLLMIAPGALAQSQSSGFSDVLYDQTDDFEAQFIAFRPATDPDQSATAADDFVVPENSTWTIEDIFVSGVYLEIPSPHPDGPPSCDSVDVGFWSDAGAEPGDPLFFYSDVVPASDVGGDLSLDITDTVLESGTYWLSIQCRGGLDLGNGIRGFYWRTNDNAQPGTFGHMAVAINPGGGLDFGGTADTTWIPLVDTSDPPPLPGYDFSFLLNGTSASATSVDNGTTRAGVHLDAPYPNPAITETTVGFSVAAPQRVRVAVYDLLGREVQVLFDGHASAGTHKPTFRAAGLSGGIYVVRLQGERGHHATRHITLLR